MAIISWGGGAFHSWQMNKKQNKGDENCFAFLCPFFELHLHNDDLLLLLTHLLSAFSRTLDLRSSIAYG